MQKKESEKEVFAVERCEDLEGLNERRKEAQECSRRYRQKMTKAYGKTIKERIFIEGQIVLRTTDHVRRGLTGPFKFLSKWEGPFMVREANVSGYSRLAQMDGKWFKSYYT